MLLLENLPLAVAIVAIAYAWSRAGFRAPRILSLPTRVIRRVVVAFGWTLVLGITVKSVGGFFGDQRISTGVRYAYRSRDPLRFWAEIVGEMLMVGGTGAALIFLGRKARRQDVA
jgi:hypothetical protein